MIVQSLKQLELIDTLWNVNNEETNTEENKTGINRYIMECKLDKKKFRNEKVKRINRYIMECKCERRCRNFYTQF